MEHTCFGVLLYSEISMFNGTSNIDILINLCLGNSLYWGPEMETRNPEISEIHPHRTFEILECWKSAETEYL